VRTWIILTLLLVLQTTGSGFVPKPEAEEPIPKLRPARAEIPATFWERNGSWMAGLGVLMTGVAGFLVWRVTRPRPVPPVLPENEVRDTLRSLEQRPETGAVLSGVTRAVRRYFIRAFDLPAQEPTTTEFCALLSDCGKLGSDLSNHIVDFLRECDRRKFAPAKPASPVGAVNTALTLIDRAETRRVELRQAETSTDARKTRP
jgi:hypothetical protein